MRMERLRVWTSRYLAMIDGMLTGLYWVGVCHTMRRMPTKNGFNPIWRPPETSFAATHMTLDTERYHPDTEEFPRTFSICTATTPRADTRRHRSMRRVRLFR